MSHALKALILRAEQRKGIYLVGARLAGADAVVGVGLHRVEVEHKDQVAALHHNQLVALILAQQTSGFVKVLFLGSRSSRKLRYCSQKPACDLNCLLHWSVSAQHDSSMQMPLQESHLARHILVRVVGEAKRLIQVVHGAVKRVHELVLEVLCIRQVPPPPALFQAAAIACTKISSEK